MFVRMYDVQRAQKVERSGNVELKHAWFTYLSYGHPNVRALHESLVDDTITRDVYCSFVGGAQRVWNMAQHPDPTIRTVSVRILHTIMAIDAMD